MFNFLHTYTPDSLLISLGSINIYWYGIFIVTGILAGILVIIKLADYYQVSKNTIIDLIFYLILGGIIGARLYHILLELPFYLKQPSAIFKFWQGGLAIHGALITGIIIMIIMSRKYKLNFWLLGAIFTPGLALGQAIGRWGNYFNQELFGKPTNLIWGIPIEPANRIMEYFNNQFFHPAFLYESLGNLLIFTLLIYINYLVIKKNKPVKLVLLVYLFSYSILRFTLEFIRIDVTPIIFGLRLPQLVSLLIIIAVPIWWYFKIYKNQLLLKLTQGLE